MDIKNDIVEILISQEAIQDKVRELGEEITGVYRDSEPLLVGVLKGSLMFVSDLASAISLPLEIDFMGIASYSGETYSSGVVRITKDLDQIVAGRDVLLVETIVDTGMSVRYILRSLEVRQPRTLRLCTLLDKPARRIIEVPIDFCGFRIPDRFVVGYGLDYRQKYRNLPYFGVLKDEIIGRR